MKAAKEQVHHAMSTFVSVSNASMAGNPKRTSPSLRRQDRLSEEAERERERHYQRNQAQFKRTDRWLDEICRCSPT